ncbi:MAG TPA: hypothetical protein PLV84_04705 [Deltaproteobacteria bacterium]|nr:hypothetical protein [Deltaproteobacteria bacterium]
MKGMEKTNDNRLILLEALLRHADQCGDENPHFFKDEMLKTLDVCEHVFNVMQIRLGDRYCRRVDGFEDRCRYAINVNSCLELRNQIMQADSKIRRFRESVRNIVLASSIGSFFVIFFGCCIV